MIIVTSTMLLLLLLLLVVVSAATHGLHIPNYRWLAIDDVEIDMIR